MNPTLPDFATLRLVLPELWLVLGMCAVILVPLAKRHSVALPTWTAIVALFCSFLAAVFTSGSRASLFSGALAIDPFSQYIKVLLSLFTLLVVAQWILVGRKQQHVYDMPDFLCLLLGATFGMMLMASATNLLTIFIATESASFPSYALAGYRKRTRLGSEASMKYVLFGAAASAIMLYGMSLIFGQVGSLSLTALAQTVTSQAMTPLLALGLLGLFAGIAFKLSAVPMHFWAPDVFQGAPTEVTTFLSVASKGAAIALLIRIVASFTQTGPGGGATLYWLATGLAVIGAVTATWGNLVALHQTNIKRLLAYSSIAHVGYMLMAVALLPIAKDGQGATDPGPIAAAILFYLTVYLFMNLGAFTVAAILGQRSGPLSDTPGSEDIRDYAGLIGRSPLLAVMMSLFLLSLFGMPGLGGFMGKVYLMAAMATGPMGFALIAVLLFNTLLSLYFYMRPVYYMMFVPDAANRPTISLAPLALALLIVCAVALLWTGLLPATAGDLARDFAAIGTSGR